MKNVKFNKINLILIIFAIIFILIKPSTGNAQELEWEKTFGGSNYDVGRSTQQTTDGGYIIVGNINSFSNNTDIYLIKTDSTGDKIWEKIFGGSYTDEGYFVQQTSDDGYIIVGQNFSLWYGLNTYLIKTDSLGNKLWEQTYIKAGEDVGLSVQQTLDGGYIIVGYVYPSAGDKDVYVIKTDSLGNLLWEKTFGGSNYDVGSFIQQTTDGGYIIVGTTNSFDTNTKWFDIYLIKIDALGNKLWEKTFGGSDEDFGSSVQQITDGGYIIVGTTYFGIAGSDIYLIKTDFSGNKLWEKTFGGSSKDSGNSIRQTPDNGYIIIGGSAENLYLIKTNTEGDKLWDKIFGGSKYDIGLSVNLTKDGNYIIAGITNSFGAGLSDVWLLKIKEKIPSEFWSEIKNIPTNAWSLRQDAGLDKNIIKIIPKGWTIKIKQIKNEAGQNIDKDSYRWYKVEDIADGTIGWMAAESLIDGTKYLEYNANIQTDLEKKAAEQLDIKEKRTPVILEAVDKYHQNIDITNSLYGTAGGKDGLNNFQKFIQGSNFPKELILAIIARESGNINFNNEFVSFDYGHGDMQITFKASTTNYMANTWDNRGIGSSVSIPPCKSIKSDDYKKCYSNSEIVNKLPKPYKNYDDNPLNPIYKQYTNTFQSIYANIKDGFRVLQEKYRQKCFEETSGNLYFTCSDIRRILTIWGYNGFGDRSGSYLNKIAQKLESLSDYFSGVVYSNTDQFIQKLRQADRNKILALLGSPGELHIKDSNGNITGVIGNQTKEDIPNSLYEPDYKGVAIFFPKNPYIYRIVGTDTGTYDFDVDFTDDGILKTFKAIDIPVISNEIYEYLIDWQVLDRGEKGTTVKIDKDGNGVIDYQFKSGSILEDKISPQTAIEISGIQGNNDWYVSDAQISFQAQDNNDGVGILKTEYSLDNGLIWNTYVNPFAISNEGTSTILYRSQDFFGNLEEIKQINVKIDKTSPEAIIYFNKSNQGLKIEGIDNLTQTIVVLFENNIYLIQDGAGNTLKLYFDKINQNGNQIKSILIGLQYNNNPIMLIDVKLFYEWAMNKNNEIKELEQKIYFMGQFDVKLKYNQNQNDKLIIAKLITNKRLVGYILQ